MQQVCSKKNLGPLNKKRAPLQQEVVGAPMERVVLDILRPLRETREGISTSMVVRDYLSKCMEAYPVPDHRNSSREVCQWVWLLIRSQRYCIQINFESQKFKEMCGILGINKTRTTPYNPKSDRLIEKFNHTLITTMAKNGKTRVVHVDRMKLYLRDTPTMYV